MSTAHTQISKTVLNDGGLTPVASGGPPLDPAALDATGRGLVKVHGVLHDGRELGLDLRCTDTLLKESWLQHKHGGEEFRR